MIEKTENDFVGLDGFAHSGAPQFSHPHTGAKVAPSYLLVPIGESIHLMPAATPNIESQPSSKCRYLGQEISPHWPEGSKESNISLIVRFFLRGGFRRIMNLGIIRIGNIHGQWCSRRVEFRDIVRLSRQDAIDTFNPFKESEALIPGIEHIVIEIGEIRAIQRCLVKHLRQDIPGLYVEGHVRPERACLTDDRVIKQCHPMGGWPPE